jgi:hypothetical protein
MAALGENNTTIFKVRNAIDHPSISVAGLCVAPVVNGYSPRKPIDYNAAFLADSVRSRVSGFVIDPFTQKAKYRKPQGGLSSPYRLADFRGYLHDARRPQPVNIVQNAFQAGENYAYGSPNQLFSFGVPLPNIEIVKMWGNEAALLGDVISLYDDSGVILTSGEETDFVGENGKYQARYYLNRYTENDSVWFLIEADLSSVGVGMLFTLNFQIWYGSSVYEDYKRFQLENGDTVTVTGKVQALTVLVNPSVLPLWHFPPLDVTNAHDPVSPAVSFSYNSTSKVLTITNMQFRGTMSEGHTSTDRRNFEAGRGWKFQYSLWDQNYNQISGWTDIPVTDFWGTTNVEDNTYSAGIYSTFQLTGIEQGDIVNIELIAGDLYDY